MLAACTVKMLIWLTCYNTPENQPRCSSSTEHNLGHFGGSLHSQSLDTDKQNSTHKLNITHKSKQRIPVIQQNKSTLVQSLLTALGQEMRWAYSTMMPSLHVVQQKTSHKTVKRSGNSNKLYTPSLPFDSLLATSSSLRPQPAVSTRSNATHVSSVSLTSAKSLYQQHTKQWLKVRSTVII